jgi:hypothetical protein
MISVRDLTGKITSWIEIGTPDSARLHRASKAANRVVVYCHKEGAQWLKGLAAAGIHRAEALELYAIDRTLIAELVSRSIDAWRSGVDQRSRALRVDRRRESHRPRRAAHNLIIHRLRGLHGLGGAKRQQHAQALFAQEQSSP